MVVAVAQSAVSQLSAERCEGVGKGALVCISLGPPYAMVVAVAQSAVSQLSAGR